MNRWGRIVWTLAAVATAAWLAGGLAGYRVADLPTLARHTLLAFSALLALALTHLWVAVYVVVFERLMRDRVGLDAAEASALRTARRRGLAGAAIALIAAIAQFTSANALYPARLDPAWHAGAGLVTLVALGAALALEAAALRRAGRVGARSAAA
jgi:hypothetical protein